MISDGSAYSGSDHESSIDNDSDNGIVDEDFVMNTDASLNKGKFKQHPSGTIQDKGQDYKLDCGLCGQRHGPGACHMVESSANLAEYREMLILHADDEPWEDRVSFHSNFQMWGLISCCDRTRLWRLSTIYFIRGGI